MRIAWGWLLGMACLGLVWGIAPQGSRCADTAKAEKKSARDASTVAALIDAELDRKLREAKMPASPAAGDAEFLRRIYLDITGRIPTPQQAAAFLDSKDPDKRRKLIDELLASPNYGRNFATIWTNLLLKRDEENAKLDMTPFTNWLAGVFNQGRSWDRIVSDILLAEGKTKDVPQAIFFLANRDMNAVSAAKVTGTTANLFMGVNLHCAECHNHPSARQWKQTDFWGMAAFFGQVRNTGSRNRTAVIPIQTIREIDPEVRGGKAPRQVMAKPVDGGSIQVPDPTDPMKTIMTVKAKLLLSEQPKLPASGPYRPTFVKWLTAPENKYLSEAAVNRLWNHFFTRGFVNPLDDFQEGNPPSHPELLRLLGSEFVASGYDLKHMIRCICNSKAYQRTSQPLPENESDTTLFSHLGVKVMSADVLYDALLSSLEVSDIETPLPVGAKPRVAPRSPLLTNRQIFIRFFDTKEDDDDRTDFTYGIPQFLRLRNAPEFTQGGTIVGRLMKEDPNPRKVVEGLFLATLSRRPTPAEAKKMSDYVARQSEPRKAYAGVLWILMNTAEFVCVR